MMHGPRLGWVKLIKERNSKAERVLPPRACCIDK